jgi:hypothetical protein
VAARPAPKPAPTTGVIAVAVASDTGEALAAAEVTVEPGGQPGPGERAARTGSDGRAVFPGIARGPARIRVIHAGHRESTKVVDVAAGRTAAVRFALEPALPPGQLRGLVRSFRGRPLAARLEVAPLGIETRSDARGEFEIDLPPGEYQVSVDAPGYRAQERRVKIEKDGVTILNVDLRR